MPLTLKNAEKARRSGEFSSWAGKFNGSRKGQNALNALRDLTLLDPDRHQELEHALMLAAFHAASYMKAGDEDYRRGMDNLLDFANSHQDQTRAIEILERKVAAYSQWVSLAFRFSHSLETRVVSSQEFGIILSAYKSGLATLIDKKDVFVHLHERIEGCLRYPGNARRRRMGKPFPGALNSFLFEATVLLRRWDLGISLEIPAGATMPGKGKASYGIVAAFANATFSEQLCDLSGPEVGDRLRKLLRACPKISYIPWHDVNGNFEA